MPAKKRPVKREPLLAAVARKLGHAAGTLSKVTQELTESLSTLPETVTKKVRKAANMGTAATRSRSHTRHPKKKVRNAVRMLKAKASTGPANLRARRKTRRSRPNPTNIKSKKR